MCATITKPVKKPTKKVVAVWKAVYGWGTTRLKWEPWAMNGKFNRGEWVKALDPNYGFNCFTNKKDALFVCGPHVLKCRARLVEGYGVYCGRKVVFAREIFVPKGRKK